MTPDAKEPRTIARGSFLTVHRPALRRGGDRVSREPHEVRSGPSLEGALGTVGDIARIVRCPVDAQTSVGGQVPTPHQFVEVRPESTSECLALVGVGSLTRRGRWVGRPCHEVIRVQDHTRLIVQGHP